jgi:hypothetical protein
MIDVSHWSFRNELHDCLEADPSKRRGVSIGIAETRRDMDGYSAGNFDRESRSTCQGRGQRLRTRLVCTKSTHAKKQRGMMLFSHLSRG